MYKINLVVVRLVRIKLVLPKERLFLVINHIIKLKKIINLKQILIIILLLNNQIKIYKLIKSNKTNLTIFQKKLLK